VSYFFFVSLLVIGNSIVSYLLDPPRDNLLSADLKTGEIKWQLRVAGPFSGSPVAAGGHLFVFNEKGEGHCVKLGDEAGELVSTGNLADEVFMCTPAISNGAIYVRSDQHLWKISAP
jgi:outer membrane protein assembly factor BamB